MSGEIMAVGRSADSIATEIRVIVQQARAMMAAAVIEVGKRLIEAQELVPHGEWGEYVTHSCGFSQRTAQAYMQLAANPANAQTIADLPYSKALALLALPEGKIEEFRAEHHVEDVSVRELKKQIAEYKDRLENIDADYRGQLDTVDRENDQLRAELQRALDNNGILGERASQAEIAAQNLRYDLEQAKKQPTEISAEDVARLRAEGAAKAHSEHAEAEATLAGDVRRLKMELQTQAAEKDGRIAELERQLAETAGGASQTASSADLAINEIKVVVAELQTAANKLHGCYIKHRATNPKLAASVQSMVEKMISNLYSNFGIDPI